MEPDSTPAPAAPATQADKERAYWSAVDAATDRTKAEDGLDRFLVAALQCPMLPALHAGLPNRPENVAATALQLALVAIQARDEELKSRGFA